jgi:hypothetical protein
VKRDPECGRATREGSTMNARVLPVAVPHSRGRRRPGTSRRRVGAYAVLPLIPILLGAGCAAPTAADEVMLGSSYRLISIDWDTVPARYYESPDGSYFAVADSGSLTFFADSMVRVVTQRRVYISGDPTPYRTLARDSVRYRREGASLLIARSATEWDTAVVRGTDSIWVDFTIEGISLGRWRYER